MAKIYRLLAGLWVCLLLAAVPAAPAGRRILRALRLLYVAGADGSISVTGLSAGDYGLLQTEGVDGYDLLRESPIRLEEGQTNRVTVRIPPELELPDLYPTHRIWALALLGVGLLIFILALVFQARR